jgi:hypothetical protein
MRRALALTLLMVLAAGLGGCGVRPAPFPTPQSDLDDRPGLMSGPDGEFTLYRR